MNIRRIAEGLNLSAGLAQLDAAPHLWNARRDRTASPESPHAEADDIWLRWLPDGGKPGDRLRFLPAWWALPGLHDVVWGLMGWTRAVELGGLLLTRIPPGGRILPHSDAGGWHADMMDRKFYVPLRSGARCVNVFPEAEVNMRPGEVWEFRNDVVHSVENHDASERISLIVCMRTETQP